MASPSVPEEDGGEKQTTTKKENPVFCQGNEKYRFSASSKLACL